jgi:hypothetical protein
MNIRTLKPSEINVKVKKVGSSNGKCWGMFLLYKDARCDMSILDEIYGPTGWKREHIMLNGSLWCVVSVWDANQRQWVPKMDVGTESESGDEKTDTKGEASDSFKRACVNWGIGRELYTSPKIFINLDQSEVTEKGGKYYLGPKVSFSVTDISYDEERNISSLVISDGNGKERFIWGEKGTDAPKAVSDVIGTVASAFKGDKLPGDMLREGEWSPARGYTQLTSMKEAEAVRNAYRDSGAASVNSSTYEQYRMAYCSLMGQAA